MSKDLPSTPPTDDEIANAIQYYVSGRARDGVRIAEAVVDITCNAGVVKVVFDPAATRITEELFRDINPYDNLARFVGTPVAGTDDTGNWVRQRLVRVDTVLPDGRSLGTMTADELLAAATGEVPES
ncbi:hypothetical protein GS876_10210 [Rhodococcus hoagii]|nr:hypothetical protein [Prescottella equi]NKS94671.1 hypothetical protein [Prescottella equi]NKT31559.1 hypothetical protein [Prescottella equi]NKT39288.1 hypothetical protein [Prescottella equi]NKT72892.1 hypothetical protein [Prescottella equi]